MITFQIKNLSLWSQRGGINFSHIHNMMCIVEKFCATTHNVHYTKTLHVLTLITRFPLRRTKFRRHMKFFANRKMFQLISPLKPAFLHVAFHMMFLFTPPLTLENKDLQNSYRDDIFFLVSGAVRSCHDFELFRTFGTFMNIRGYPKIKCVYEKAGVVYGIILSFENYARTRAVTSISAT